MTGVKTKRPYRKSTPIGRLRRNVGKLTRHATLLKLRVSAWGPCDSRASVVEKLAGVVVAKALEMDNLLSALEDSGFVPPEQARIVSWEKGQRVAVGAKFRPKYEIAFQEVMRTDAGYLDSLVVEDVLPSGEVVVRRRGRSPFLVPKTHLVDAEEDSGG